MSPNPGGKSSPKVEKARLAPSFSGAPIVRKNGDTHDGTLVDVCDDGLVMSNGENKQHSFHVANDAYVCCDGVTCLVKDLKVGSKVRLTVRDNDKNVAIKVESLVNQVDFADQH